MRSLISFAAATLLALIVWPGNAAAGQSQKKKAKARAANTATQTTSKSKASSAQAQAMGAQIQTIANQDGIPRITPASARDAMEKDRAIIVDVRGEDSYNAGHVKGARWINLNEIESRTKDLPRDKMIITYCS
jgi:hypothetical protein